MLEKNFHRLQLALLVAMGLAGLGMVYVLPASAQVAIHFDMDGKPNGWASPLVAAMLLPATLCLTWGLFTLLPRIDPRADNLQRSAPAVRMIATALAVVLALLQAMVVGSALGLSVPMAGAGLWLAGGVLMVVGNVMGKLRPNYSVGFRTPWTLAHERVWDQTHRFGGKVLVLGGGLLWAMALLPSGAKVQGPAVLAVVLTCAAVVTLKSYGLWRRLPPSER
jgi:uncharacterized membrane protein